MNSKTKITLWIILTALLDIGSLVTAVLLKPWLIDAEINLVIRNAGFFVFVLFFIAIHGGLIYYVHRPLFRSKYFNFSVSVLILLIGLAHLFGATANIMVLREAGEQAPAPEAAVTTGQKDAVNYAMAVSILIISLCAYFSFIIYNSWDRTEKFEDVSSWQEVIRGIKTRIKSLTTRRYSIEGK